MGDQRKKVFLEKVFPELLRDYSSLYEHLSVQQWEAARILVHKLKGIVALLDLPDFFADLGVISECCKMEVLSLDVLTAFQSRYSTSLTACSAALEVASVS